MNNKMLFLPRTIHRFISFLAICLSFTWNAYSQDGPIDLKSNFGQHPRILFFKEDETSFSKTITADPFAKSIHQEILRESDRLIDIEPIKRIQIGRRLLDKSREALRRIFQLSYAYRTTHAKKYFDRTEKEMLAIAAFSDWNPSHFLDVAEMTMAMAIGYDWLYQDLSNESKTNHQRSHREKGFGAIAGQQIQLMAQS